MVCISFGEQEKWYIGSTKNMPEKFDSFDQLRQCHERAEELLGLNKKENPIDPQKIGAIFTTPKTRKAFEQIDAATVPRKGAIEHKKRTVIEVREKKLIDQEVLKNNPTVYVGAGIDFEYPLSLGAREIILVDPVLKDGDSVEVNADEGIIKILQKSHE